jgi:branched-chain amino acid aminotransferase
MTLWHDGAWLNRDAARASADDRGFLLGDGLFETIRVKSGQVVRLKAHFDRLESSGIALGLPHGQTLTSLETLILELVERNALVDAAVRVTLTAGRGLRGLDRVAEPAGSMWLTAAPWKRPPTSLSLATSGYRRSPTSPAATHKTLSYVDNAMARRVARHAGADMALILDTAGHLSGADCANLFWLEGEHLLTPALHCGVLPGTARACLLDQLDIESCEAGPGALVSADAVWVTNALMGAVPVRAIDARHVSSSEDQTRRLNDILAA